MTASSQTFDTYVPVYDAIPEDWEDARAFLVEQLREITNGVNARDYAYYVDIETLTGQQWVPGTGDFRQVFRKVVDLGGLPDFGATNPKTVAHGITTSVDTCPTRLYGTASDPGASSLIMGIPLPFVDMAASAHIELAMDATNIIIRGDGSTDYSAYTCAWAVIEWIDEA